MAEGEVYLRSRAGNRWVAATPEAAKELVDSGEMLPATRQEYEQDLARREAESVGGRAATFAEGAGAGFFGAALAPAKLATAAAADLGLAEEDYLRDVTGRGTLAGARFLAEEAIGGEGAVAERQYEEAARTRAQVNPATTGIGFAAGSLAGSGLQIAGGGAIGALGRAGTAGRAFATASGMALEGAAQGVAEANEAAWIQDHELTAEQLWGSVGMGAVLGAGFGAAPYLAKRGFGKLRKVFGKADDLEGVKPTLPSEEAVQDAVEQAFEQQGVKVKKGLGSRLLDVLEDAQVAASGAKGDAEEAIRKYGFHRWDEQGMRGKTLYRHRQQIVEDASRETAETFDKIASDADDIIETAVYGNLRRKHIERLINRENNAAQVAQARAQFSRIRQLVEDTAPRKPQKGAGVEEIARHQAANDTFGNLRARQALADHIDDLARTMDGEIDGADAFAILDEAKRTLQMEHKALKTASMGAARSGNRGKQLATRKLADYLESVQEPTRKMLEDTELWGDVAGWQSAKNKAFVKYMDSRSKFTDSWQTMIQRSDYDGRPVFAADPAKIKRYMEQLGTAEGVLPERYVRQHLAATRELTDAIMQGSDQFAEQLKSVRDGYGRLNSLMDRAEETVKVANQIDSLVAHEQQGMGGGILGAILAGAPGAAVGAAIGAITRPGTTLRQAAVIQEYVKTLNDRMGGSIGKFLRRGKKAPLTRGAETAEEAASAATRPGAQETFAEPIGALGPQGQFRHALPEEPPGIAAPAAPASSTKERVPGISAVKGKKPMARAAMMPPIAHFLLEGKSEKESYKERAAEVRTLAAGNGQLLGERVGVGFSGMAGGAPKTYGALAGKATAAVQYLSTMLPASFTDPELARLGVIPSDVEINRFRKAWETVANPMSVLDDLENGRVDPVAVDAIKAVYPRLFEQMRTEAMTQLMVMPTPPPLDTRVQLDLLLDMGGAIEPTLSAASLQRRAAYAPKQEQQPAPRTVQRPPRIAENYGTRSERMETL